MTVDLSADREQNSIAPLKRKGETEDEQYYLQEVAQLDKLIRKTEKRLKTRTLYRYLEVPGSSTPEEYAQQIAESGNYSDDGYMSTTEDLAFIAAYAHERKKRVVILEIETDRGISTQQYPGEIKGHFQTFEKERLLPRGMKFLAALQGKAALSIPEDRMILRTQFSDNKFSDRPGSFKKQTFPIVKLVDIEAPPKE